MGKRDIDSASLDAEYLRLKGEAEGSGYHLNPDISLAKELIKGLLINEGRYGYRSCPCRLAQGVKGEDRDIICPCDYRDADLSDYGACYCGLYVSEGVAKGERVAGAVPERRHPAGRRLIGTSYPIWRCPVCGYLCARVAPPERCPICKAEGERFERFQ